MARLVRYRVVIDVKGTDPPDGEEMIRNTSDAALRAAGVLTNNVDLCRIASVTRIPPEH